MIVTVSIVPSLFGSSFPVPVSTKESEVTWLTEYLPLAFVLSDVMGARAKTAMAVLVDVSASMGLRTDRGKVLMLTRTLPLQIFFSLLSHLQNDPQMRWRPALRTLQ